MRPLRWKASYRTRTPEIDRHNRSFVDCLNGLLKTATEREHCHELDQFLADTLKTAEKLLETGPRQKEEIPLKIRHRLVNAFPLDSYRSEACRECGICDIGRVHLKQHLRSSDSCLTNLT
jgi:hypothetical protein